MNVCFSVVRIKNKTCAITTDGATNYVKAFQTFGRTGLDNDDQNEDGEEEADPETPIDLAEILDGSADNPEVWLPKNIRCAAHTLSLVAKKDSRKAEHDRDYKRLSRALFAQLQGLWNLQARSTQKSDDILEILGSKLIIPNETRWNSFYDALVDVQTKIQKNPEAFWQVLERMPGLRKLRDDELLFLNEYINVMRPVAQGLDRLQGETDVSLGYLLPTISSIKKKLDRMSGELQHCQPLLESLLQGIRTRFDHLYDDDDYLLAACTIPKFKTMWMDDHGMKERSRRLLKQVEQRLLSTKDGNEPAVVTRQNSFFEINDEEEEEEGEVDSFLKSKDTDLKSLKKWPNMEKLFRKYNTALPSSASVERMFSKGSLVFQTKRHSLLDSNFEIHVFMKSNVSLF